MCFTTLSHTNDTDPCILRYFLENGRNPFVLVHESGDKNLADRLASVNPNIPVIHESNPLYIKGIIGHSKFLIGSRFHSLVSGLSQGVPSLGTGWSHKYIELFDQFPNTDHMEVISLLSIT